MTQFFKNPFLHFLVVALVFISVTVLAGSSIEKSLEIFLSSKEFETAVSEVVEESPSTIPQVLGTDLILPETATETALVSEVIDGDTIRLSTGEKVRYIGVDTPETVDPNKEVQCYGGEASIVNEQLVLGKMVVLEKDLSETDRYGRLLRYVWLDGMMVNQYLVQEGYAVAKQYKPDTKYHQFFEQAQAEAQVQKKGLWANCQPK